MKIQNLAIIFLVIAIPIILVLSYYLNLQQKTLKMQAEYDTKLSEATKEAIKAFEVNTVDWSEWKSKRSEIESRNNAKAVVNTFTTSIANNLNISGTAKEYIQNYIPAIAMTMYDGYYIYAPAYTPVTIENSDGCQLFFDNIERQIVTNALDQVGEVNSPIYKPKEDISNFSTGKYIDDNNVEHTINYVTNIDNAEMDYEHTLSNRIAYSSMYTKNGKDYVINYTLDNRIYVYGDNIEKDGYLVYFDENAKLPRAYANNGSTSDSQITVYTTINSTNYEKTSINTELLEEQILYIDGTEKHLETFKYIYDIEHEKLYYDSSKDDFFTLSDEKNRQFIGENTNIKYKSVSILWGNSTDTTEYKKIYQALNGTNKGKWYINLKNNSYAEGEKIDTQIQNTKLKDLGLDDPRYATIYRDFSAISYYVEAYAFTNWAKQNLNGNITQNKIVNNTVSTAEIMGLFNISKDNNPEDDNSLFVQHKKEVMQENILSNLNSSISAYNRNGTGDYGFKLPMLTYSDWEQIFNNVSLVTFFQGIPIGLKYYNNYAIATSTTNREYVDPGEIYFSGEEPYYHRVFCEKCENIKYTGYRSVEYVLKKYTYTDLNTATNELENKEMYYYEHDNQTNANSENACYYCLANKANFKATNDEETTYTLAKAYNEALARERYYQKQEVTGSTYQDMKIYITKKKISISNKDVIVILDDSGSMEQDFTNVKNACGALIDKLSNSANYYMGFIRFSSDIYSNGIPGNVPAEKLGYITNTSSKDNIENVKKYINKTYGKTGGTDYNAAFAKANEVITSDLAGRTNDRIIIFMTDGAPNGKDYGEELKKLRDDKGVKEIYIIAYEGTGNYGTSEEFNENLKKIRDVFSGNSEIFYANKTNLQNAFDEIFYAINDENEEGKIEGGKINISDIKECSQEKPIIIIMKKAGTLFKEIKIPGSDAKYNEIIVQESGNIFIDIEKLTQLVGIEDFNDIEVEIQYFRK